MRLKKELWGCWEFLAGVAVSRASSLEAVSHCRMQNLHNRMLFGSAKPRDKLNAQDQLFPAYCGILNAATEPLKQDVESALASIRVNLFTKS